MEWWEFHTLYSSTPTLQGRSSHVIKIKRVGHLVLKVKDLERSRKFFTEVLGFPQVGENDRGMLFFRTDAVDAHHMRALREAKPSTRCRNPNKSAWRMCRSNSALSPRCKKPSASSKNMMSKSV